jgi:hypothetical protein
MARIYYVDIPDIQTIGTDNESWINLATFPTKKEAVAYCLEHICTKKEVNTFISIGDDGE